MEKIGKYVLVNNINELKKDAVWEEEKRIRTSLGIFEKIDEITFPQTFRYVAFPDTHCCGKYWPCDKTEMAQAIIIHVNKEIEKGKKIILDLLEY